MLDQIGYVTIAQAAVLTGISESRLRRACREHKIPCVRDGNRYLIDFVGWQVQLNARMGC